MKVNLKNRYFFLRHGKNIHQTELKDIIYCYPDDETPCSLIEEGIEQAKKAGEELKDKKIEYIYCSDILRTRQTAKIVAGIIGFNEDEIIYDTRLRDINWGLFGGKHKDEAWAYYNNDKSKKFNEPTPGGETWNDCRERMKKVLNEIENIFQGKNVLIVSHGDPLWLLEGYIKGINDEELLNKRAETLIQTGEVREIYE
ncbi:MAG: histidine phosphatase family protein [Candidatus Pacebacteria bacterium]|jgi:broad specificity phosphatase PhoE|nr:histidine phosphatase family protein [Candidatus Paceibacterota bacterium]MDD2757505.1 histidine phosphatase family protein [Candidatus Paceibacterota bacterium]MDD3283640.1 histidine phosphatase family protein [Candidatus Paceibacterota bacterium]MDD3969737.1 histidine phosphatase family protein [Candidatus Paceibacterota bacterium]MDD4737668.1 histidine phosphatase family protein [Candidatus Paceibacterota bacterium]